MTYEKELQNIKAQQEESKQLFFKCQGVIEYIEQKIKENKEKEVKDNVKSNK